MFEMCVVFWTRMWNSLERCFSVEFFERQPLTEWKDENASNENWKKNIKYREKIYRISRLVIDTVVVFYEIINQIVQSADIDVRYFLYFYIVLRFLFGCLLFFLFVCIRFCFSFNVLSFSQHLRILCLFFHICSLLLKSQWKYTQIS